MDSFFPNCHLVVYFKNIVDRIKCSFMNCTTPPFHRLNLSKWHMRVRSIPWGSAEYISRDANPRAHNYCHYSWVYSLCAIFILRLLQYHGSATIHIWCHVCMKQKSGVQHSSDTRPFPTHKHPHIPPPVPSLPLPLYPAPSPSRSPNFPLTPFPPQPPDITATPPK